MKVELIIIFRITTAFSNKPITAVYILVVQIEIERWLRTARKMFFFVQRHSLHWQSSHPEASSLTYSLQFRGQPSIGLQGGGSTIKNNRICGLQKRLKEDKVVSGNPEHLLNLISHRKYCSMQRALRSQIYRAEITTCIF